jgi:hypothetical protein
MVEAASHGLKTAPVPCWVGDNTVMGNSTAAAAVTRLKRPVTGCGNSSTTVLSETFGTIVWCPWAQQHVRQRLAVRKFLKMKRQPVGVWKCLDACSCLQQALLYNILYMHARFHAHLHAHVNAHVHAHILQARVMPASIIDI